MSGGGGGGGGYSGGGSCVSGGGGDILPLCGSILQTGTCQILSLAEHARWNRVWQFWNNRVNIL